MGSVPRQHPPHTIPRWRPPKRAPTPAHTRYRLRLTALDADGNDGAFAVAGFATLAPPVRNLSGTAVAQDAVRVSWDGPAGWSPVSYVVQWRLRGPNPFLHLEARPHRQPPT